MWESSQHKASSASHSGLATRLISAYQSEEFFKRILSFWVWPLPRLRCCHRRRHLWKLVEISLAGRINILNQLLEIDWVHGDNARVIRLRTLLLFLFGRRRGRRRRGHQRRKRRTRLFFFNHTLVHCVKHSHTVFSGFLIIALIWLISRLGF